MSELDLAIQDFLVESRENLDQLDLDLIAIEKRSGVPVRSLDGIFRTFHTIKGTCGFFDFPRLEALTHAAEGLLGDLREGRIGWGVAITGILLQVVDGVRRNLSEIAATGFELPEELLGDDRRDRGPPARGSTTLAPPK